MRPAETKRLHKSHIDSCWGSNRRKRVSVQKYLEKRQDKVRLKNEVRKLKEQHERTMCD